MGLDSFKCPFRFSNKEIRALSLAHSCWSLLNYMKAFQNLAATLTALNLEPSRSYKDLSGAKQNQNLYMLTPIKVRYLTQDNMLLVIRMYFHKS